MSRQNHVYTDKIPILYVLSIYSVFSPPKCNLKPEKDLLIKKMWRGENLFKKEKFQLYVYSQAKY